MTPRSLFFIFLSLSPPGRAPVARRDADGIVEIEY
jgi:hypothetical protein